MMVKTSGSIGVPRLHCVALGMTKEGFIVGYKVHKLDKDGFAIHVNSLSGSF
jgi:hypothetical protein